ncbi:DUF2254 domain-containing protein [Maribacter sp. 2210JD10-5]|uniref:DUF2254 domain-containing protein n=1 Tax=Maribacter sp. 2210JD10-5 TaxID=3386272 RepID=UPI0039BD7E8F
MLSVLIRIYKSISFLTFFIAVSFGLIGVLIILFPVRLNERFPVLAITDKEHIKFILTFTIGGIFTLTVFSYTMVMNVLNRSISNYSPRLIPLILYERPHQIVLGTTSGTIIYSLLMSAYLSGNSEADFPDIAAPLTIFFVIICVLLFIYFIHHVSQSIHVNYVIHESFVNTRRSIFNVLNMKENLFLETKKNREWGTAISFDHCGYLNKIRLQKLLAISKTHGIDFNLPVKVGTFVLENQNVLESSKPLNEKLVKRIKRCISIDRSEPINVIEVGFKHLTEVAIKASSPAINDPGTSLIAIDYLAQLFIHRKNIPEFNGLKLDDGGIVYFELIPTETLFKHVLEEMERYMNEDPILKKKLQWFKTKVGLPHSLESKVSLA